MKSVDNKLIKIIEQTHFVKYLRLLNYRSKVRKRTGNRGKMKDSNKLVK